MENRDTTILACTSCYKTVYRFNLREHFSQWKCNCENLIVIKDCLVAVFKPRHHIWMWAAHVSAPSGLINETLVW